jgi:hypothetical protein
MRPKIHVHRLNGGKLHPETRLELSITAPHPQTRLNFPGFGRRFQEIEPHSRIPGKRSEIPDRELAKTLLGFNNKCLQAGCE